MASSKLQAFLNHPAGPKTIHFWAPTFKWGISIANVADFTKPPEKIPYSQQIASHGGGDLIEKWSVNSVVLSRNYFAVVAVSGLIWTKYSTVITPRNLNLLSVNAAMAATGLYQLSRKIRHDYFNKEEAEVEATTE